MWNNTLLYFSKLLQSEVAKKITDDDRRMSLIDEVKLKADYKAWKKKNVTAIRMRKNIPAKDPNAVCVRLPDNALSHERLKQLIEKSTGSSLTTLQFDPVSVHSLDTDAKSQWILKFDNPSVCDRLVESGLPIEGRLLPVRRYDDVMKDEHEAYKYFLIMNEIKKRKQEKLSEKQSKPKLRQQRKLRSSHTQTGKYSNEEYD